MPRELYGIAVFVLVCVGVLFLMPTPPTSSDAIVIEGALLFDGERFREGRQVWVEDGRIVEVGVGVAARAPAGAQRFDARGKTLLPGLIDAHTHSWGDALGRALRAGVTTQIDMFTETAFFADARSRRDARGPTDRADLFSAGALLTAAGGHGTQFGLPLTTLDRAEQAEALVEARAAEGSDFIKLVIEDGSAYGHSLPTLDAERVEAAVRAARARDLLVVAHVSTREGARMAVEAGVDGLVHIFHDAIVDDALVADMVDREVFVIPTLAVIAAFAESADAVGQGDAAGASLYGSAAGGRDDALDRALESVRLLHAAGVPILAGTDAPNPGTEYGASLHVELGLLRRAGLHPAEALAAATSIPASVFPLGTRGRVRQGARADLLLVDGDPREDLSVTSRIDRVFKNGHVVESGRSPDDVAAETARAGTISDFEGGSVDGGPGFGWEATTDEMAGGRSSVAFEVLREAGNGFVQVETSVREGFPYPWSGLIYFPGSGPMAPVDATGIETVRFRSRGDVGSYRVLFFVEGQNMPIVETFSIETSWREHTIGLDAVPGRGKLTAIAWVAGPARGDFRFDLDDVRWGAER